MAGVGYRGGTGGGPPGLAPAAAGGAASIAPPRAEKSHFFSAFPALRGFLGSSRSPFPRPRHPPAPCSAPPPHSSVFGVLLNQGREQGGAGAPPPALSPVIWGCRQRGAAIWASPTGTKAARLCPPLPRFGFPRAVHWCLMLHGGVLPPPPMGNVALSPPTAPGRGLGGGAPLQCLQAVGWGGGSAGRWVARPPPGDAR